ncbi:MAG TPA: NifU family protein [Longimicrobiales bacterium]
MLTFTETARRMVRSFMAEGYEEQPALRVAVRGSPFAPEYELSLVDDEPGADDVVLDGGGFRVLVDRESAGRLEGSTIDYVERAGEVGFEVRSPNGRPAGGGAAPSGPLAERVRQVIEQRINPAIAAHGGYITLMDVKDDVVYIEMSGGCQGCGMARVTLRHGVERMIREAVPEVARIEDVTDHASGQNPYYAAQSQAGGEGPDQRTA